MLTSISPVGEATRGQRWWLTATAYVVGSLLGGAAIGLAAGGLGAVTLGSLAVSTRLTVLAVVAVLAAALELRGIVLPSWQRQVDERWLDRYRGWVYGAGFGFQLGTGVMTIVSSNLLHVAVLAFVLTASPLTGLVAGAVSGLARALPLVANAAVRTPASLRSVMRRLSRVETVLPRAAAAVLVSTAATAWLLR